MHAAAPAADLELTAPEAVVKPPLAVFDTPPALLAIFNATPATLNIFDAPLAPAPPQALSAVARHCVMCLNNNADHVVVPCRLIAMSAH